MFNKILNLKTEKVSVAAAIISIASFLSLLLGLLRERLLAGHFDVDRELDVYLTAFKIPDFVATVLVMGAISVAIIPIFTDNLSKDREKAFHYLSNLLNLCLVALVIICGILFIFTPQLINIIAPGFLENKKQITVELTRIMFLSPILMGISNMISAVLMVFKRFLVTAVSPILYNLGSIIGILFFVPKMGIMGLAWGIILGAVMHLAIQLPSFFKTGFKIQNTFNFLDKDFLQTIKLTIPRAIGLTASQINLIIITAIGSTLAAGSITFFSFANDLSSPILVLVAVPFAVAVFPALSLAISRNDKKDFLEKFYSVARQIIFLIVPVSGLCYILRAHLIRLVFGAGKFDWTSTKLTAACFGIFMIPLLAQGLIFLISRAFYAIKNTAIPALVSIFSIMILPPMAYFLVWALSFNNAFSYFISYVLRIEEMNNLAVVALPLAVSIDVLIQFIILLVFLKTKIKEIEYKNLFMFFAKVLGATVITMILTYIARQWFGGFLGSSTFIILFLQTAVTAGFGFLIYGILAHFLKLPEIGAFRSFLFAQLGQLTAGFNKSKIKT